MNTAFPDNTPPNFSGSGVVTVTKDLELTPAERALLKSQHRLGLPLFNRFLVGTTSALFVGTTLGAIHGARREGLRFRAENAHRLPVSQKGWYYYHKSKNYTAAWGGVKEGLRMGFRTTFWVAAFVWLEAAADHHRGYGKQQDFLSTTLAGVVTAGAFSAWHGFPAATTVRTGRLGFKIGLGLGLVQDMLGLLRGRKLAYVEYGKRIFSGRKEQEI